MLCFWVLLLGGGCEMKNGDVVQKGEKRESRERMGEGEKGKGGGQR